MTFGKTSEQKNFRDRVASHSTKGHANGRVDVLPPKAVPDFGVGSKLSDQIKVAKNNLTLLNAASANLNKQFKSSGDQKSRAKIKEELARLQSARMLVQTELGQLEKTRNMHGDMVYAAFYRLADAMLPKDVFIKIDIAARDLALRGRS